jgi:uncharacterized protein DUF5658
MEGLSMRKLVSWAIAFNVFNIGDVILTYVAITYFGRHEGNPLMAALMAISPWLALAVKMGLVIAITVRCLRAQDLRSLRVGTIILALVCLWNLGMILWRH